MEKAILNLSESQRDADRLQEPELQLLNRPDRDSKMLLYSCMLWPAPSAHWKWGLGVRLKVSTTMQNKLENYLNIIPCRKLTVVDENVDEEPTK